MSCAGLLLFSLLAQAQAPPRGPGRAPAQAKAQAQAPRSDPALLATFREAIQQATALRKTQESIVAAIEAKKATRTMLTEQVAVTEKTLQSLRDSIAKIDERYESLTEAQQGAVREAWSLAQIFNVFVEYLKESVAKPDSAERQKDLISNTTSTARRSVMLEETLSRLNTERRPRG